MSFAGSRDCYLMSVKDLFLTAIMKPLKAGTIRKPDYLSHIHTIKIARALREGHFPDRHRTGSPQAQDGIPTGL
jgi:hypothetical protein